MKFSVLLLFVNIIVCTFGDIKIINRVSGNTIVMYADQLTLEPDAKVDELLNIIKQTLIDDYQYFRHSGFEFFYKGELIKDLKQQCSGDETTLDQLSFNPKDEQETIEFMIVGDFPLTMSPENREVEILNSTITKMMSISNRDHRGWHHNINRNILTGGLHDYLQSGVERAIMQNGFEIEFYFKPHQYSDQNMSFPIIKYIKPILCIRNTISTMDEYNQNVDIFVAIDYKQQRLLIVTNISSSYIMYNETTIIPSEYLSSLFDYHHVHIKLTENDITIIADNYQICKQHHSNIYGMWNMWAISVGFVPEYERHVCHMMTYGSEYMWE
eukprot:524384_1